MLPYSQPVSPDDNFPTWNGPGVCLLPRCVQVSFEACRLTLCCTISEPLSPQSYLHTCPRRSYREESSELVADCQTGLGTYERSCLNNCPPVGFSVFNICGKVVCVLQLTAPANQVKEPKNKTLLTFEEERLELLKPGVSCRSRLRCACKNACCTLTGGATQSYLHSCMRVHVGDDITVADCEDGAGGVVTSALPACRGPSDNIVNDFGQLACVTDENCLSITMKSRSLK